MFAADAASLSRLDQIALSKNDLDRSSVVEKALSPTPLTGETSFDWEGEDSHTVSYGDLLIDVGAFRRNLRIDRWTLDHLSSCDWLESSQA
jgi:hypothetical protein